jgi:hypothetical protein
MLLTCALSASGIGRDSPLLHHLTLGLGQADVDAMSVLWIALQIPSPQHFTLPFIAASDDPRPVEDVFRKILVDSRHRQGNKQAEEKQNFSSSKTLSLLLGIASTVPIFLRAGVALHC